MFCANNLKIQHNRVECQLYFHFYSRLTHKLILSESFASGISGISAIPIRLFQFYNHFGAWNVSHSEYPVSVPYVRTLSSEKRARIVSEFMRPQFLFGCNWMIAHIEVQIFEWAIPIESIFDFPLPFFYLKRIIEQTR